ncbi:MAG TPA: hypothetical protein VED17_08515 [Nitrososphaerales archaeon]|nr:hypothetical protein [Nitrososphaerales archaeon]
MDPLGLVFSSSKISEQVKKRIMAKRSFLEIVAFEIEKLSGISYPAFYVEPTLFVSTSPDDGGEIGILYARNILIEVNGKISILVQLSAPLVLYATKSTLRIVMAHEFLHYLEFVRLFSRRELLSEISPETFFEEQHEDATRAVDPSQIFPRRSRLAKDLQRNFDGGYSNEKLNEKCRKLWIERGLPTQKLPMGSNQVRVSVDSLARSSFDHEAVKLLKKIDSSM